MSDNREFIKNLQEERALSMSDAHRLDEALGAQKPVQDWVTQLEDESPSLAWRSALNERLIAASPAKPARRFSWFRWAGVAAVTASVALVAVVGLRQVRQAPAPDLSAPMSAEQVLVDVHHGASFALDSGVGDGSRPASSVEAPAFEWTASDLEML